jgi:molybdenum cofactor guanylyltransferase
MFEATGIILAGGRGSRMNGADKARLIVNRRCLLDRQVETMRRWFSEIIIVAGPQRCYEYDGVKQVFDEKPDCGPLMGLYSGLRAGSYNLNFVIACDMPYISDRLVELLMNIAIDGTDDVIVPLVNGFYEPLLAVYHKCVLPHVKDSIDNGQLKMVSFYDKVNVLGITEDKLATADPKLLSFLNINTPHDWNRARQIFGRGVLGESG